MLVGCEKIPNTAQHEIATAKRMVADQLRDPESAKFRNVYRYVVDDEGKKSSGVCGEVNGKNLRGAYVGFTRFMVGKDTGRVWTDPETGADPDVWDEQARFDFTYETLCKKV